MPLARLGQSALPATDDDRAEAFHGRALGLAQQSAARVACVDEAHRVARLPDHGPSMCFFQDPDGRLPALTEEQR